MNNVTGGLETSHRRYTEKLTEVESDLKKLGKLHATKAPFYHDFSVFSWKIEARNLSENCLAMSRYSTSVSVSQVLGKTLVKAVSLGQHFKHTLIFTLPTEVTLNVYVPK